MTISPRWQKLLTVLSTPPMRPTSTVTIKFACTSGCLAEHGRRGCTSHWLKPAPIFWMPQLAVDRDGRVWVIWSEQTGQTPTSTGNWDIYARSFDGNAWGPLVRVSDHPKPDINPHVTVDAKRNIYIVWQGHADNTGDVMLARFDGQRWSKPLAVTSGPESDWFPQADVDAQGKVWIAFDSYRNGDYDVFLTSVEGDRVGPIVPIATSRYLEAHPTVACARTAAFGLLGNKAASTGAKTRATGSLPGRCGRPTSRKAQAAGRGQCTSHGRRSRHGAGEQS